MNIFNKFFPKKDNIVFDIDIKDGMHLRPCAKISSLANKFNSKIIIKHKNSIKNMKDMNAILSLGISYRDKVEIEAKGYDSSEAIISIKSLFDELSSHDTDSGSKNKELVATNMYSGEKLDGISICNGIAVGVPFYINKRQLPKNEKVSFEDALSMLYSKLETLSKDDDNDLRDIFVAQSAILDTLPKTSFEEFDNAINSVISKLQGTPNEPKIADYKDIRSGICEIMYDLEEIIFPLHNSIIIANEILPSDISKLILSNVKGIVLKDISSRSHVALLLRSYNIPTLKLDDIYALEGISSEVILDSNSQLLITNPASDDLAFAKEAIENSSSIAREQEISKFEPAITRSGKEIEVLANITDYDSALEAKNSSASGIGLLRTEFLFQKEKPTVDMQIEEYEKIFMLFDEITVRTLDVGGDKKLPYLVIQNEENPFLGIRGVRLFATHLDIMREQLYAILMAKKAKNLKIMFPMVSSVDEFVFAKNIALEIAKEHEIDLSNVAFGIMVEVPSVLFLVNDFNKVVDFYSIGTNDLSQYLFAIDRTHALLDIKQNSTVILDAIKMLKDNSTKPVSICGELASDTATTQMLIEIGIDTLSVPPPLVPSLKSRIRDV